MQFWNFFSETTDLAVRFSLSSMYSIAHHHEWVQDYILYKFIKKCFQRERERNVANGLISWKHSCSESIYCFQNRNKKDYFSMAVHFLMFCVFKGRLSSKPTEWFAVTSSARRKQARSEVYQHTLPTWNQNCSLLTKIFREISTRGLLKGKNCPYMAISFDTELINSPVFPRHIIIYLICQICYLTTMSSEQLTYSRKVCLVNHKERWWIS